MQKHRKLKARILSLAMSVMMVATSIPAPVFAAREGGTWPDADASGVIVSFDKLEDRFEPSTGEEASEHIYGLAVELDTPFEDLELPTELTAMVKRTTTTVSTPSDAEDTGDTVPDHQPASPSDAEEEVTEEIEDEDVPLALEPEDEETTVTTTEQETIPVTWNSDKEYVSDENGQFIYTAEISEDYILADGVELPQIYVLVGRQARAATDAITVTIEGKSYGGATLIEAIDASGVSSNNVTSLKVTAGKVTAADWKIFKSLTALTTFEIADSPEVTAVADISNQTSDALFPPSIVSVTVPQKITIGDYVFSYKCPALTTANFPAATSIGVDAFSDCPALTTADFPAATTIGDRAFARCSALTTANFPAATSINSGAFDDCTALTTVNFPAVTHIRNGAFSSCTALTSANVSAVTFIDYNAFFDCTALTSVSIPATVTIGNQAFYKCTKLATLKLGATPPTTVDDNAFTNCPATRALGYVDADGNDLTGDALAEAIANYKAAADTDGKWYGWKIGAVTGAIIVIINGTEYVGSSLQKIIGKVPGGAAAVTSLKITAGKVTEADWNDLKNLTALTTFEIANDSAVTAVANIPNGTSTASIFPPSIGKATVPQEIIIGDNAFRGCAVLTSASFPAATSIGAYAFANCSWLTSVSFPAVTSIGAYAFGNCYYLKSVSLPAATSIGDSAFSGCPTLTSASFPAATSIGMLAFTNCSALTTLKLGATPPTTVGDSAFEGCPATRALGYVDADGKDLTGSALTAAIVAYKAAADTDGKWYGWTITSAITYIPVTDITDVPTTAVSGVDCPLSGTVIPADATNKTIVWTVKSAGTTGATISGSTLKTTAAGTVTVTATITNGLTASSNYTQDFTITVNVPKTPSGIAVTTPPTKTAYTTGQTFDKTGMVVTATYADSTTAAVSGYTFSPTTALATSDTTITISYTENGTTVTTTQTITVTNAPATHTITASAGTGGSISPSGTVTVNNGESKTFTISANSNYSIASVTVDGVNQGTNSTYTFSNVTGNHTISAAFRYNGGGGGGGGSSSDRQAIWTSVPSDYQGGTKIIGNVRVPDYTVEGAWKKNENGTWNFSGNGGQVYANSWAPVFNPYADVTKGQSAFDWFKFDANGIMITGWHIDADGNTYYLNQNSDNTLGAMKTGWVLIDGKYYYFNEMPDGTRGKLFRNTTTPDGYLVDENGVSAGK